MFHDGALRIFAGRVAGASVILNAGKNPRILFLNTNNGFPSASSGQALRFAQDDSCAAQASGADIDS
jgi:hypothetical protein